MLIDQISVFVENKFGRLAKIVEVLGSNGIDISALSIADSDDFGVLRTIVDDADKAMNVLRESGVAAKCTKVIAVALEDQPGGLSKVLDVLTKGEISIDYMYAFVGKQMGKAIMVVKTDNMEKSVELLKESGIEMYGMMDIK